MNYNKNIRLTAFFQGKWVGQCRTDIPFWILVKQKWWGSSGISWTICKSFAPRCREVTTPAPHHSVFTGRMLFLLPNQPCQGLWHCCVHFCTDIDSSGNNSMLDGHNVTWVCVTWWVGGKYLGIYSAMRLESVLDWVLSCWVHFTVHRFICVYLCVLCVFLFYCIYVIVSWARWGGPDGIEA